MKNPLPVLIWIISLFYPFLSSRCFKIKCSFINENNISSVSILISLHHFTLLFFYFFICFWCELRWDIRVTIFFQNIIYCSVRRSSEKSFFWMFVISLILISWFSLIRSTIFWSISESNFLFLPKPDLLSKLQFSLSFLFR